MANISASLEIQGKGNLTKYLGDQNKSLTTFNKSLSLSEKNMKDLTVSTKSYVVTGLNILAKSQRKTEFYLSKFVVKNFFYDVFSSARIQTLLSVLFAS